MAVLQLPLVIIGPTASGKSDLALALAEQVGGEILSVDSMQVYRKMDIGTAKPTHEEQALVKHHLIDLVDPNEEFTVARFVELADNILKPAGLALPDKPIIATGGTPLYYKALFEGLFEGPGADDEIRTRLNALDGETLHAQLTKVDPVTAQRLHRNDTRRMIRALEVFELTSQPISSFQTDWDSPHVRHPAIWIGLHWEKEVLNRRINSRVKKMIAAGWVDEVRSLPPLSKTAAGATGYPELFDYLAGKHSLDDAIELIKIATRQLARKQMKWLRRFPKVTWLAGDLPMETLAEKSLEIWKKSLS